MSEFGVRTPELLIDGIRQEQNKIEEHLEEQFLAETLFHKDYQGFLSQVSQTFGEYTEQLGRMQQEFLQDKRGKDMLERFVLAMSDKYLGKIDVVELGSTDKPGESNRADGLKDDYLRLLDWMQTYGFAEGELSRQESQRSVSLRRSNLAPNHLIVSRNRPLVQSTLAATDSDQEITLGIVKRMTFGLPEQTVKALHVLGGKDSVVNSLNDERALSQLEVILDNSSGGIIPIRTSYYLSSRLS